MKQTQQTASVIFIFETSAYNSLEKISQALGISVMVVTEVLKTHFNNSENVKRMVNIVRSEFEQIIPALEMRELFSNRYESVNYEGSNYEARSLQEEPNLTLQHQINDSIAQRPNTLKKLIGRQANDALSKLDFFLTHHIQPLEVFPLVADCLAVLDPAFDSEIFVKVFDPLDSKEFKLLLSLLTTSTPEQYLRTLLLTNIENSAFKNRLFTMCRFFLISNRSKRCFDSDFELFLTILSKWPAEGFNLAMKVAKDCNLSQLTRIREVLRGVITREDKSRFIELNLAVMRKQLEISPEGVLEILELIHQLVTSRPIADNEPPLNDKHNIYDLRQQKLEVESTRLEGVLPAAQLSESTEEPSVAYSYTESSGELHMTLLKTGEIKSFDLPLFKFKKFSSWSALPGNCICFTGGSEDNPSKSVSEAKVINCYNLSVSELDHMLNPRDMHSSVYHRGILYVIGGRFNGTPINLCEQYSFDNETWTKINPLPSAASLTSVIIQESAQCLYSLGGYSSQSLKSTTNSIHEFNFEYQTWRTLQITLPAKGHSIACFKLNKTADEIFMVLNGTLYSWNPGSTKVYKVKTLSKKCNSISGPSYFSNDTLYCSNNTGAANILHIGSLSLTV